MGRLICDQSCRARFQINRQDLVRMVDWHTECEAVEPAVNEARSDDGGMCVRGSDVGCRAGVRIDAVER